VAIEALYQVIRSSDDVVHVYVSLALLKMRSVSVESGIRYGGSDTNIRPTE